MKFSQSVTHSPAHSLTHSLTRSLAHSLTCLLTRSLTHGFLFRVCLRFGFWILLSLSLSFSLFVFVFAFRVAPGRIWGRPRAIWKVRNCFFRCFVMREGLQFENIAHVQKPQFFLCFCMVFTYCELCLQATKQRKIVSGACPTELPAKIVLQSRLGVESGRVWCSLGRHLTGFCSLLGGCWLLLGTSWASLGPSWTLLAVSWPLCGAARLHFGSQDRSRPRF